MKQGTIIAAFVKNNNSEGKMWSCFEVYTNDKEKWCAAIQPEHLIMILIALIMSHMKMMLNII